MADTSAVLRGCLDLSIAALCWGTTSFSDQSHLEMASWSREVQTLSVHQNPHHLTSEHALSMPYVKGGHRWSLASHAMGVTSTKCCCSSCVRNVPYGVNVLKPQLLLWILVSLSSALHICAVFAFSLNLLRNYCRILSLAMHCFLHLCCRHITGAESVIAVTVYLLWPSAVH